MPDIFDNIHEECGVFGVYDTEGRNVAPMVYYGLFSLQHRGQESCGIAVSDRGVVSYHKDMGLVGEVFATLRSGMCAIPRRVRRYARMPSLWLRIM